MRLKQLAVVCACALMMMAIECKPPAPKIESFEVTPVAVCPGAEVAIRWSVSNVSPLGATRRLESLPESSFSGVGPQLELPTQQVHHPCETTEYRLLVANHGYKTDSCDDRYTDCASRRVVVSNDPRVARYSVDTCQSGAPETATLTIGDAAVPGTTTVDLIIQDVRNCTGGGRAVTVRGPGGGVATIQPGGSTGVFAGRSLYAAWDLHREVAPTERCPVERETVPGPPVTPPPAICLEFEVTCGCARSPDACSNGRCCEGCQTATQGPNPPPPPTHRDLASGPGSAKGSPAVDRVSPSSEPAPSAGTRVSPSRAPRPSD